MYLGLDLGTSSLKAIVIDAGQRLLGEASAALAVAHPHPGWSEQAPADWIGAARAALGDLRARVDLSAVRGIGLSGQMHGAVLVDARGEVLRPAILWNDTRAAAEAARLDAEPRFRALTGNIVFPGFTAPKLVWVAHHEPETFARVARVLLPKDYLRLWLTGEAVSEMSDASGTSWLDTGARVWSDDLLAATGMRRAQMPRLVEGSEVSGTLRAALATELGLPAGIPVAGGAGDNAAAGIGLGVVRGGQAFVSLGTSGVLFAAADGYSPDPATAVHTFAHALPGVWHQMGVILAATDSLNWLARLLDRAPGDLTAGLGPLAPPSRALFLPYLGGERTPLNDAAIRAGFLGLGHATGEGEAVRALLEGVAFALADCRDALARAGTRFDRLIATGGGARSDYWLALIATVLGVPVDLPAAGGEGAALGAARLGLMAATGADAAEAAPSPEVARTFEPDPQLAPAFAGAHARWRRARDGVRQMRLD